MPLIDVTYPQGALNAGALKQLESHLWSTALRWEAIEASESTASIASRRWCAAALTSTIGSPTRITPERWTINRPIRAKRAMAISASRSLVWVGKV